MRDRLTAFARGAARAQRHGRLAGCRELVAARRTDEGGWELVLLRHGRLAGTAVVDRRTDPLPVVSALRAGGEHVEAPLPPATAAHPEETDLLLGWLEQPGVRLVAVDGEWSSPVRSAQALRDVAAAVAMDLVAPRAPLLDDAPDRSAAATRRTA